MFAPLPPSSFIALQTRRLRAPVLVWPDANAVAGWFDPAQVHCLPHPDDPPQAYADERRLEFADHRDPSCTTPDAMLQTKNSWALSADATTTPAGPQLLAEALLEAVYAEVFARHLPFSVVPVMAVVAIHGAPEGGARDARPLCGRGLALRPFVTLPQHFMRSPAASPGYGEGPSGWSADALRTRSALSVLAANLAPALDMPVQGRNEHELVDAGLRELARRVAWQAAASFCKRLTHGRSDGAPFALSGAYLDFDLASHVPAYSRWRARPSAADPWDVSRAGAQPLAILRRQLAKYHPRLGESASLVAADELLTIHDRHLGDRVAIEMAKMGGLTEDLAAACPPALLDAWLQPMREIWTRGAEPHVACSTNAISAQSNVAVARLGRHDLNAILAVAAQARDGDAMDASLTHLLGDAGLRTRFVVAALAVRRWLRHHAGTAVAADRYIALQARRKNASLDCLLRDGPALHGTLQGLTRQCRFADVRTTMSHALGSASRVLADLDPDLPGVTGIMQLQHLEAWRDAVVEVGR